MTFIQLLLLPLSLAAGAAAWRWPVAGVCTYLWFDFMRPLDYFPLLRAGRPMTAIMIGLLVAAAATAWREGPARSLRGMGPIALLAIAVLPGSLLAGSAAEALTPLKLALVSWVLARTLTRREDFDRAFFIIAASLTVLAIDGLWEALSSGLHRAFEVARVIQGPLGESDGLLRDNNDLARGLLLAVPLWVSIAWSAKSWPVRAVACLAWLIVVEAVVFTGSCGGFVALGCAATYLHYAALRPLPATIATILFTALLIGGAMPEPIVERMSTIAAPAAESSVQSRVDIWKHGLARSVERPLFGHGVGTFAVPHAKGPDHPPRTAHNIFVELLYETGALGLVAYLIFLASTVMRLRRARSDPASASWPLPRAIALEAALVGFTVASLGLSNAFQSTPFVVAGLAIVLDSLQPRTAADHPVRL